jgi:anhydro-N-acetylmuramic acid kinase
VIGGVNRIDRLVAIANKPMRRVVGLMSGTSVDAIDAVLAEVEGYASRARVRVLEFRSYPFPPGVRERIFRLFSPETSTVNEICHMDFLMGELFAEAVCTLLKDIGMSTDEVDLIGCTGQTIWHAPRPVRENLSSEWIQHPIQTRATLAIGQSAVIAERTGIITVGDLRVRDVAAGGHGAPIIAYADWVLIRHPTLGRCVQNIGGIGNVTYLPPDATLDQVMAFDTGPGNMVIDALTDAATGGRLAYDVDGQIARGAQIREDILAAWMKNPYFDLRPPKTTGRERFGTQFAQRAIAAARERAVPLEDLVATATALTAHSIARAYHEWVEPHGPVDEVILGGGGSHNPYLIEILRTLLPSSRLLRHEDIGIDSKAKEPLAIALIANDALLGLDTNVPRATSARPTVLGKINL